MPPEINSTQQVTGGTRSVKTQSGTVRATASPFARQTYVPLPSQAKGQAATIGANVPAILASNARQTHPVA